jgi:hypothetical protein
MEIISENDTAYLILTDDGSTESRSKASDLNRLIYDHNLHGLLVEGDEVWTKTDDEGQTVTVVPGDEPDTYTLRIEGQSQLFLGEHQKTDLIDGLAEVYEEDSDGVQPLLDLHDRIRSNMMRKELLSHFISAIGDKVAEREDGWMINGHLLLDYEGEFHHPSTDSRKRSGQSVIGTTTATSAYGLSIDAPTDEIQRSFSVGGTKYRLTDREVKFIAKTVWAVKNTPDRT